MDYATDQIFEPRIAAQWVEAWFNLEIDEIARIAC
jgi:hypothetical protein